MLVMLRLARKNLSWVAIEQYRWFLDVCLMKEGWRTRRTLSRIMRTLTSISASCRLSRLRDNVPFDGVFINVILYDEHSQATH